MYGYVINVRLWKYPVIIGYTNQNSNLKLTIRNSLAGQIVFDKKQPGEHEIEGKTTKNMSEWNLAHENCHYFEFAWFDFYCK